MLAVISGASRGIGLAVAEKLASKNFNLALCARSLDELNKHKKHLEKEQGIEVYVQQVDVTDKTQVKSFAEAVLNKWDKVDILFNNAGDFQPGDLHEEEDGQLEKLMETNLYSAYHLTRSILPGMMPHKSGHIFNMCSVASILAYPNSGSYTITKFALLGFSKSLREEMKAHRINVTSLIAGATYTDSWSGSGHPEERFMRSSDIAQSLYDAYAIGERTCVEEILLRPVDGDI